LEIWEVRRTAPKLVVDLYLYRAFASAGIPAKLLILLVRFIAEEGGKRSQIIYRGGVGYGVREVGGVQISRRRERYLSDLLGSNRAALGMLNLAHFHPRNKSLERVKFHRDPFSDIIEVSDRSRGKDGTWTWMIECVSEGMVTKRFCVHLV
jgi:hypothetical protein